MAIATLTGAADLACGHAFSSKVYAAVGGESIWGKLLLWVRSRPNRLSPGLPLWSDSGSLLCEPGRLLFANLRSFDASDLLPLLE